MFPWLLFNTVYRSHDCSLLPIEETKTVYEYKRSENKAGFDKYEIINKLAQCPICKEKHTYGLITTKLLGFVSYKELN